MRTAKARWPPSTSQAKFRSTATVIGMKKPSVRRARPRQTRSSPRPSPVLSSKAKSRSSVPEGEGASQEVAPQDGSVAVAASNAVVLKIRRRKFQRTPARAGEIIVTRRLFRTGDSEYLLNGKLCRLRDIQDIFMGTGLGPESYAIIGQERIGQLLSSKPHDRRAIIEEAAGITRFKTKKRLAELRLESAKQNLARVNDIFEEVTRQMNSLKRQAAKAERYAAVRDELRTRLRVVLASRLHQMDATSVAIARRRSPRLTSQIDASAAHVETLDAEHAAAVARGYELDASAKEASARASQAASRSRARQRPPAAPTRSASPTSSPAPRPEPPNSSRPPQMARPHRRARAAPQLPRNAAAEAARFRQQAEALQQQAREAAADRRPAEQRLPKPNDAAIDAAALEAGQRRNQASQAEEALGVSGARGRAPRRRDGRRAARSRNPRRRARPGSRSNSNPSPRRWRVSKHEILDSARRDRSKPAPTKPRRAVAATRCAPSKPRSPAAATRSKASSASTATPPTPCASSSAPTPSSAALASPPSARSPTSSKSTASTKASSTNSCATSSTTSSSKAGTPPTKACACSRATSMAAPPSSSIPHDAQAKFSFDPTEPTGTQTSREGIVRLKDCIRVLDGFGTSLEAILPKLREGYVTPDAGIARSLALENPHAFFLAPSGECFHNVTVTGGKPRAEGPLALKRELRETQQKLDALDSRA